MIVIKYKIVGNKKDDFKNIDEAMKWLNKNKITLITISEWQWGYTIFYKDK